MIHRNTSQRSRFTLVAAALLSFSGSKSDVCRLKALFSLTIIKLVLRERSEEVSAETKLQLLKTRITKSESELKCFHGFKLNLDLPSLESHDPHRQNRWVWSSGSD